MNTDQATVRCPKCDGTIPADAPQGLCPLCVLAGAAAPTDGGIRSNARLTAPSIETVAAAFPQFEILGLVGLGGMGVVYKVRQPKLDRIVALKLLPMSLSADPAFAERFHREARFLARLSHPQIVSVYDFGESGGFCYLLMEFVDGVNLRQAMQAGRFTPAQALAIIPDICAALQYAHDQGVLHRDIKPENILLDAQGRVKIADFGIAKLVGDPGDPHTDLTLTQSGARLGTPHYMAPEQIEKPADVDHRADIYSLGVVFYELLTGELPLGRFAAPSAKTPLDSRVDEIVMRALAKERELRQQSAGEVKTQCETVAASPAPAPARDPQPPALLATHDPQPPAPLPDWARRAAWLFLLAAGVAISPTLLSRRTDMQVLDTGVLLALTGIALLTRGLTWRVGALVANFWGASLSLWGLGALPFFASDNNLPPGWTTGGLGLIHNVYLAVFSGLLHLAGFIAGIWILCHRSVRPAFGVHLRRPDEPAPNPWPHRLCWLVIGLFALPASAVVASLLAPMLHRGPAAGLGGLTAGLVPMAMGAVLVWLFVRTQPTPSRAKPQTEWNPWPKRIFWAVTMLMVLSTLMLMLGLILPQLAGRRPTLLWMEIPAAPAAIMSDAQMIRAERSATESQVRLRWELRSALPAVVRLSLGARRREIPMTRIMSGGYGTTVTVLFERQPKGNEVLLMVQGGDATEGGYFNAKMDGDAGALLAKANELVAGDLSLKINTPVWIAFAGLEQIRLEILPAAEVSTPATSNSVDLREGGASAEPSSLGNGPAEAKAQAEGGPSAGSGKIATNVVFYVKDAGGNSVVAEPGKMGEAFAALRAKQDIQIDLARQRYDEARAREAVGAISPLEVAATARDLAVAEARGEAVAIAEANIKYARLVLESTRKQHEVGKATTLDLRGAEATHMIAEIELTEARRRALAPGVAAGTPKIEVPPDPGTTDVGQQTREELQRHATARRIAKQRLEQLRKQVEVGLLAPRGFEMLEAESTVAIAEADLANEKITRAAAVRDHAEKVADTTMQMNRAGKASDAQLMRSLTELTKASEAVSSALESASDGDGAQLRGFVARWLGKPAPASVRDVQFLSDEGTAAEPRYLLRFHAGPGEVVAMFQRERFAVTTAEFKRDSGPAWWRSAPSGGLVAYARDLKPAGCVVETLWWSRETGEVFYLRHCP